MLIQWYIIKYDIQFSLENLIKQFHILYIDYRQTIYLLPDYMKFSCFIACAEVWNTKELILREYKEWIKLYIHIVYHVKLKLH